MEWFTSGPNIPRTKRDLEFGLGSEQKVRDISRDNTIINPKGAHWPKNLDLLRVMVAFPGPPNIFSNNLKIALLTILKIMVKRYLHHWECKFIPGNISFTK